MQKAFLCGCVFTLKSNKLQALSNGSGLCKYVECCFKSTETEGLLGMGVQDSHLDFHTAPELSTNMLVWAYIIKLSYMSFLFFFLKKRKRTGPFTLSILVFPPENWWWFFRNFKLYLHHRNINLSLHHRFIPRISGIRHPVSVTAGATASFSLSQCYLKSRES